MPDSFDKIGVFVAGGPAAGINGVIKGIVQEADNAGIRVVGFINGARGLVRGEFCHLTRERVENINFLGGSILGTSRFKIDPAGADLQRILENLRREGIDGLVAIGGEGTLQLADHLRRAGIRIIHVPKTIDNDIAGVHRTFGFSTAAHEAARMLTAVKLDAETSANWFVVEIMGRYTGHLALEAGLAAGCTRVLIPEEGPIDLEELLALIQTRARAGQNWGVILVAESAHFGDGFITRYGRLGGIADELAVRLDRACAERGIACNIRTSNLGYFLRCAEPNGFDRAYAARLGLGAAQFILDPACSGQMVTVVEDRLQGVPMESVAGKVKYVDLNGISYKAVQAMNAYESARLDIEGHSLAWQQAPRVLTWLDSHTDVSTVSSLAMRLGLPMETVLEVLQELVRVETGEAAAGGSTPP
ncbi:MAG TPA: 6-phosphofructokinase [Armatimonadota bacterium]|nr:6-phosphofructokinase [Armatimonadota bacterium]